MCLAHLMADGPIDVFTAPVDGLQESVERLGARLSDPPPVASPSRYPSTAACLPPRLRRGRSGTADDARCVRSATAVSSRLPVRLIRSWVSRTATLADPIVRDANDGFTRDRVSCRILIQEIDGRFQERPTALRAHDQAGLDRAQVDQVRHLHHSIQNAQTGIGNIVHEACGGNPTR